jgi:hypothetical protein
MGTYLRMTLKQQGSLQYVLVRKPCVRLSDTAVNICLTSAGTRTHSGYITK